MADDQAFVELRPSLFGIAYRMLGSATEADDLLQEAFLRWQRRPERGVDSPRAYLTSVVVRLCIDQLGSARVRREAYVGQWLPEPVSTEPDPADSAELADTLSLAFLVLLEELSPAERAAFILREVFSYSYPETAAMLGRGEPACRQLVSRATRQIGDRRPHLDADRHVGEELAVRFLAACADGDVQGLLEVLAPDVVLWGDGGGKAKANLRPVVGAKRASRFLINVAKRIAPGSTVRLAHLNGQPGFVIELDGLPTTATAFDVIGGIICGIRITTNPDKLRALAQPSG
ncbi:MAG: RNA polymerase sigma-70 factor [Acidimicrobiales bacterium]